MHENEQAKYREKLLRLRHRLAEQVRETMSRTADKIAAPDELSHVPTHPADRDSDGFESDIALEANREQMLDEIEIALKRVDNGSYGRCENCGCEIPKPRLEVLPFASRCVDCEAKREER